MILLSFQVISTSMKTARKITFLALCFFITLSWGVKCVSNIIKTNTEKNIQDRKEALPGGELDIEDKNFELVYELPSFKIPFLTTIATELNYSKVITLPQTVFLNLSIPPPEFNLFA